MIATRRGIITITLPVVGLFSAWAQQANSDSSSIVAQSALSLTLKRKYSNVVLMGTSPTRPEMLLWTAKWQVFRLRNGSISETSSTNGDSTLKLVDIQTGKTIGQSSVGTLRSASFDADEQTVLLLSEDVSNVSVPSLRRNQAPSAARMCEAWPERRIEAAQALTSQSFVVLQREGKVSPRLSLLRAPDCHVLATADPLQIYPFPTRIISSEIKMSSDSRQFAILLFRLDTEQRFISIRKPTTLEALRTLYAPEGWTIGDIEMGPSPNTLIAYLRVQGRGAANEPAIGALASYDLERGNHTMIRTGIDMITRFAVSPNGKWIATGHVQFEEALFRRTAQAIIVLRDAKTGQEIARTVHPPASQSISFAGFLSSLEFSSDSNHLISSERDTFVWNIVGRQP